MRLIYTLILLVAIPFISFSQQTRICWDDYDGREFCLTNVTATFSYSMISGDRLEYEPSYSDNAGKIRRIGNVSIEYEPSYSDNAGKIRRIGGMRIEYEPSYSNAAGKIRRTSGNVN